jgi:hypothetical protein
MITKQQAQTMRLRIIAALDTNDLSSDRDDDGNVIVDVASSFVEQMFKDDMSLSTWAKSWNIELQKYELPHTRDSDKRSKWVRFKKPGV